jgi:hypothetical protein
LQHTRLHIQIFHQQVEPFGIKAIK